MLVSLLPTTTLAYAPGESDSAELVGYKPGNAIIYIGTNEEQLLSKEVQDFFARAPPFLRFTQFKSQKRNSGA